LGYARRTQDSWKISYPQTGIVVTEVELCLDTNELPHIAYKAGPYDPPYTDSICYAYCDGDTWHVETVVRNATLLSLVLARDGTPHLAFLDSSQVKCAHKADDTWSILTVPAYQADSLRRLIGASFALDTSDRPGIAVGWYKYGVQRESLWLSFFEFDGQNWHRSEVDSAEGSAPWDFWAPRVQYDPGADLFHIVYCYGRYATGKGSNWQVEMAVGVSVGNWWYGFALHQGRPHIACSSMMDPLTYQWRWAGGWEEELVVYKVASAVSLAVDRTGRPHLAFVSFENESLYYARRLFVGTEEPAQTGVQPELRLLVHPNPAFGDFTVQYGVPVKGRVRLTLCDVQGRVETVIRDGELSPATTGKPSGRTSGHCLPAFTSWFLLRVASESPENWC
jgi:hypothetical protein